MRHELGALARAQRTIAARSALLATTAPAPAPVRAEAFIDFEFRGDGAELILGVAFNRVTDEWVTIDFRQPDGAERLAKLRHRWRDAVWFGFAIRAELGCFLEAGIDIREMEWVCLSAEARQITISEDGGHHTKSASLLATLDAFGINTHGDAVRKHAMRDLILRTNQYTAEQWADIVTYATDDVRVLPALWDAIQAAHAGRRKPYALQCCIFRGDYLKALSRRERRSRGFPVDAPLVNRIYENVALVRSALARDANATYGGAIYRHNKVQDNYSFSFAGLREHLASLPFDVRWPETPSGRLRTDEEFLDQFSEKNPYFKPLAETFRLLRQLRRTDLRHLLQGNFIKGESLPFWTLTGRNQPMAAKGLIFNMAPWVRLLVRPERGHVLIGADWKSQEIVVAASFSCDRAMAYALQAADVYLKCAEMAGAVSAGATKTSHPVERQAYKSAMLGIGYGMGVETLAHKIFVDLLTAGHPISIEEAFDRAVTILKWHKDTFHQFWAFCQREVKLAKQERWIRARDGWTHFCSDRTSFTRLQNFPIQAGAAAILREAVKNLDADPLDIEMVCSLHDAIYVYAPEDQADEHKNALIRAMTRGANSVLAGTPLPLKIGIETHTYTHETGFQDDRGTVMMQYVLDTLAAHGV